MKIVSRAYNRFLLNEETKSSIIKTSKDSRLLGEIIYYNNIPEKLKIFFPRILNYNVNDLEYKLELEYYAYNNLGIFMLNGYENKQFWNNTFDFLFSYIQLYKKESCITYNKKDAFAMFVEKTETEYENLFNNFDFFNDLRCESKFYLNGKELKSFYTIWDKIKKYINDNFYDDKFYFIHGDFCFSNILCGHNDNDVVLKYIDPRGIFGSTKFYGDLYYDLAKLSHSTNGGYEFFIYDKFDIKTEGNRFNLNYDCNKSQFINDLFLNKVDIFGFNKTKIKLIEGLIFIGMCARHYDSLERQKAMFITGLNILNQIYEEI